MIDHLHLHVDHVIQPLGQETTANTLLFATILIHQHPDVLDKCVFAWCIHVYVSCTDIYAPRLLSEVENVLGDRQEVTGDDLDKLKYTEQVWTC